MSLSQLCGIGILSVLVLWMFGGSSRKYNIDLDGPKEVHWLTGFWLWLHSVCHTSDLRMPGNVRKVFEGGLDYCMKIAEQYGGAVKLQSLYGVSSDMQCWSSEISLRMFLPPGSSVSIGSASVVSCYHERPAILWRAWCIYHVCAVSIFHYRIYWLCFIKEQQDDVRRWSNSHYRYVVL